ncbi:hypothetical protein [Streptomyces sp. NPDC056188]|uniref:hypothetical protein n=1 Tax=Streptomyces sp. NPDC056188 TaxID=3345740 RepID=UPI0035E2482E
MRSSSKQMSVRAPPAFSARSNKGPPAWYTDSRQARQQWQVAFVALAALLVLARRARGGSGSGTTCRRRPAEWTEAGVWFRLHEVLLDTLRSANALDFSRAAVDDSHARAVQGAPRPDEVPLTGAGRAPWSSTPSAWA